MKRATNLLSVIAVSILCLTFLTPASMAEVGEWKTGTPPTNSNSPQDFVQGVVILKVAEGIGPFEPQHSNIRFGVSTLDAKVEKYAVSSLQKRFRHKPIPRDSGLPDLSRIYRINFSVEYDVIAVAADFARDPNIEYAEPMLLGRFTEIPDDPLYGSQPCLPQIMAPEAWDIHKGEDGEEVVVAIVDTGADWKHPDLVDNTWQNLGEDADGDGSTLEYDGSEWVRDPDDLNGIDDDGNGYIDDVIGWDFHEDATNGDGSNPDPIWYQGPYDHGTHCAGIAAAATNNGIGVSSVSWNVKYMPVQTDDGNNTVMYGIDGVIYAAENGADVISNSWYHGYGFSQYEYEAMQYAIGLGSIVCFAAANDNSSDVALPAGYPGVISVAAVTLNDSKASFSNYGIAIDISSPGVLINSTIPNNGYGAKSGTSMACPMAAGLFGYLKSYQPDWSNEELIAQVLGTADDIDSLNAGFENALGDGRINAYYALSSENVIPPQELKLDLIEYFVNDENGDGRLDPSESGTISLKIKNYAAMTNSENVVLTLSTYDPEITITSNTELVSIYQDAEAELTNLFEFTVNENATPHAATFLISVTADVDVTYGQEIIISAVVAPAGFFVWDAELNKPGYSGNYIKGFLEGEGHSVLYSGAYPNSFSGFDGVFLSFGNAGEGASQGILIEYFHTLPMQQYLENGGSLYIEGMGVMGFPSFFGFPNATVLRDLFGISTVTFDFVSNPIDNLQGQDGTLAEGMLFTESNQVNNWYIDKIVPKAGAYCPFVEDNYGNVSVYYDGEEDQKTFYFGYSLADLADADPHSSRHNILLKVLEFFGYPMEEDFVSANFNADKTDVFPGEEIQFSDISISGGGLPVNSWSWDFDADGVMDSNEQNPAWTYSGGGFFDVMLVVSNGETTDTMTRQDLIMVRSGILVYEGETNGIDQSGAFISGYLEENGYEVVYTNQLPASLDGFDAVFASFGSSAYTSPELNNTMAGALKNFIQDGRNVYLEGSEALGNDQDGNNFLWFQFGLENVEGGSFNPMDAMVGAENSIMEGMAFSSSLQLDVNNIDVYSAFQSATTAIPAFIESDYGTVAVQFDGADYFGQKTFCMSYSLAFLEDGTFPNTRHELLHRVLDYFDLSTGIKVRPGPFHTQVRVYPNPVANTVFIDIKLEQNDHIRVDVFDALGGLKLQINEKNCYQGMNKLTLNTAHLPEGVYYYRVSGEHLVNSGKLIISR